MNTTEAALLLTRGRDVIRGLAANLSEEQAHWRPAPGKWSIVEVINHLYDEEMSDFRLRLHILLKRPKDPWPPMDPEAWCRDRRYNERRLFESLETFTVERNKSIEWLGELTDVDWDLCRDHSRLGPLHAGDLLAAWVAHDYLHIAQMARLHTAYIDKIAEPYSAKYAGG
jgi:hypothetical protein